MNSLPRVPANLRIGEEISRGAYGAVFAGLLGARPVAIKKIHQLLLDYASQTEEALEATLSSFRRECELLEAAGDPHIVEFLGAFNDERLGSLLVMELMDQTLEKYLEDNKGKLTTKEQIDICLQIASGLRYLHRHDPQILHRDLTPKNILLKGNKIKISDLGQAKFRPPTMRYLTTKAPGCVPYMPPECLCDDPRYNDKSDVFSLGVVMLEVATQEPPSLSMFGIGMLSEVERRANHLSKLPSKHPFKPLIELCLRDKPKERPTIEEVHSELFQSQQRFVTIDLSDLSSEIQHFSSAKLMVEALKKEPQVFRSDVLLKGNRLQSIKLPPLPKPTCVASAVVIRGKIYVGGSASSDVECDRLVQVYDTQTGEWDILPPLPIYRCEATLVKGQLTLIGGRNVSTKKITNLTITWDEEKKKWFPKVPPMPTKRIRPCIIHCSNFMLVGGGLASDEETVLDTIDVFNVDTFQWITASTLKLPIPLLVTRVSNSNGYAYVTRGRSSPRSPTDVAYKIPMDKILHAIQWNVEMNWIQVENTPNFDSGLVVSSDHPIVVGGFTSPDYKSTSDVSIYDPTTGTWSIVGQCIRPHALSCAIAVSSSSFVVIGGCTIFNDPASSLVSFELFYV